MKKSTTMCLLLSFPDQGKAPTDPTDTTKTVISMTTKNNIKHQKNQPKN